MIQRLKHTLSYLSCLYEEPNIRRIANYNIADKYKRIYFFHIRKAAGKSVTDSIMATQGRDHYKRNADLYGARNNRIVYNDKVIVGWHPILIEQGNYYYAFSHIPYHQIKVPSKTFTITSLRDPVKRVLSYYMMLRTLQGEQSLPRKLNEEIGYLGNSIDYFIRNIPKHHLMNQLYMFSKDYSVSEAYSNIVGLSYFFFLEDFNLGIKELGEKLELKLKILHSNKIDINEDIPDNTIRKLKTMLKPEYDLITKLKEYKYSHNSKY